MVILRHHPLYYYMCRLLMLLLCLAAPSAESRAQGEFTELRAADYPITAEGLP